jgi:hypothetical protein
VIETFTVRFAAFEAPDAPGEEPLGESLEEPHAASARPAVADKATIINGVRRTADLLTGQTGAGPDVVGQPP